MIRSIVTTLSSPQLVENRKTLFALVFLALSAVTMSVIQGLSYLEQIIDTEKLEEEGVFEHLTNLSVQAEQLISNDAITLHFLANSIPVRRFATTQFTQEQGLQTVFASLVVARPEIFQVRILDTQGHERLRVEKVEGELVYTPADKLQDKGHKTYFLSTIKMAEGSTYVSPLDLNMERGELERPLRPTLRLATVIVAEDAQPIGMIIMNIHAQKIIDLYHTPNGNNDDIAMFNKQGYWLAAKDTERTWGFMFSREPDLPKDYPQVWQKLSHQEKQVINHGQRQWYVHQVRVNDILSTDYQPNDPNQILWYAVAQKQRPGGFANAINIASVAVVIILIVVFSLAWVRSVNRGFETRKELIKSEKMSSLGSLVAGVSHELGTPLGSALTMASTIQERTDEILQNIGQGQINKSKLVDFIHDVKDASVIMQSGLHRASELINHFKQVAVDQGGETYRRFDVDDYIEELTHTFSHFFKHKQVHLKLELNSKATITSYPGALSQVIINLVHNALVHGFANNEHGQITIATQVRDAGRVHITVTDTGRGISAHIINQIFDPFFTTRMGQGGSGLGLHIVHSIVTDVLGGKVNVTSSPANRFTEFTIVIPCKLPQPDSLRLKQGDQDAKQQAA